MSIGSEIATIFALILINGLLSVSEAALVASRKARLQQKANDGNKASALAIQLIDNPNIFLSAVQIGITLIGVFSGAVGGATIAGQLGDALKNVPYIGVYSESISLTLVVLTITVLTIWLGELVPKRIGINSPERIAQIVSGPMFLISKIFSPFIALMSNATNFVLRILGVNPTTEPPITEEELQLLIDQGTQAGVFEESEQDMVEGVFSLGDQRVYSLMTPRTEVVWLDVTDTVEDVLEKIASCSYSRFPVREDSLESIVGIVKSRDLLVTALSGKELQLKELVKPAIYVPETMLASRALEILKEKNTELLLVVDEFGGMQGLLTINDILEEIVGEMEGEEPQATQRQDGSWLLDGMLEVDEFKEIFEVSELPHENEYETLSGFVMTSLGRMPQTTDHFEWNNLRFEVMDMDGRRVDKVLVTAKNKTGTD
ncbi:MAG: HlyC/CorC family transporter [Anaerolineales bacterium]|nr:HlyC/CorC family transporter [Anaerolineales bacterium]MCB9145817.1 HlyC/CorC family transporter [Anaerolineales bacterium]